MSDLEKRLNRLLSLIPYVIKNQGVSLQELSEVFEVPRDQLLKDLHLIFLCGQPDYTPADLIDVDIDEDRVSISMADYFARPLRFTPAELSGLYLACSALVKLSGKPASAELGSCMEKIRKALGVASVSGDDIEESMQIKPLITEQEVLSDLSRALEERWVVAIDYYSYGRDELNRRRVNPLSLEFGLGHWYLRAFDERSREVRVFRVDRIKDLEITADGFEAPSGEEMKDLDLAGLPTGSIEVRLRFSPALAAWAEEQKIFTDVKRKKGYLSCSVQTDSLAWLEREILRYGPEVEVLSPPELTDRLRARIEKLLDIYG
jgi:predicted DNA-binding transcriptional regulator YafY